MKSLFNKNAGVQVSNFIKKWLQHRCFPVNIAKFLSTAYFMDLLWWLLFQVEGKIIYKAFVWGYWSSVYLFLYRSENNFFWARTYCLVEPMLGQTRWISDRTSDIFLKKISTSRVCVAPKTTWNYWTLISMKPR